MPPIIAAKPLVPRDRIAVVVNGNARSVTAEVVAVLDDILENGDLFVARHVHEAHGIACTLLDREYGTVLAAGGDGTFTVLATAVVKEARARGVAPPRFGLLRLGTGNSLAWVVGASRPGPGRLLARALSADMARLRSDAGSRPLRLVEADGMLSPFCGFGIDANVLADYAATKALLGRGPFAPFASGMAPYAIAAATRTLPAYLLKSVPHCRVTNRGADAFRIGGRGSRLSAPIPNGSILYEGPATIASVSTIPYYGFGFRMFPHALDRPDRMQLRVSTGATVTFLKNVRSIWKGEWDDPAHVFDYFVEAIDIEMDPETNFQVGGDLRGLRRTVGVKITEPIPVVDFYAPPRG